MSKKALSQHITLYPHISRPHANTVLSSCKVCIPFAHAQEIFLRMRSVRPSGVSPTRLDGTPLCRQNGLDRPALSEGRTFSAPCASQAKGGEQNSLAFRSLTEYFGIFPEKKGTVIERSETHNAALCNYTVEKLKCCL